jgi:hypothetical protein
VSNEEDPAIFGCVAVESTEPRLPQSGREDDQSRRIAFRPGFPESLQCFLLDWMGLGWWFWFFFGYIFAYPDGLPAFSIIVDPFIVDRTSRRVTEERIKCLNDGLEAIRICRCHNSIIPLYAILHGRPREVGTAYIGHSGAIGKMEDIRFRVETRSLRLIDPDPKIPLQVEEARQRLRIRDAEIIPGHKSDSATSIE